jgi:hypothetical protein
MFKRSKVSLNGAAFKRPLIGLELSLIASGLAFEFSSVSLITGLMLVMMNTGMLLAYKRSLGRWLGRTHLPQVGLLFSLLWFSCSCLISANHSHHGLLLFSGALVSLLSVCLLIVNIGDSSYYIENDQGQITWEGGDCAGDASACVEWKSLLKARKIRSGDRLMRRELFGSYLLRAAEGMEWLAWRSEDIGNTEKATVVFGPDIASARQSAAQLMNVDPDLIVIAPGEMDGACATKLDEAAQQQKARYQVVREEEKRRKQEKKAEAAALQNSICPENSPFLLENHTTRMDRLFAQAIDATASPIFVDKN